MVINERDKNNIYEIISEAVQMEANDDIRAISIGIITANGNARTLTAVAEGGYKMHLLAVTQLCNKEALAQMHVDHDPQNYFVNIVGKPLDE